MPSNNSPHVALDLLALEFFLAPWALLHRRPHPIVGLSPSWVSFTAFRRRHSWSLVDLFLPLYLPPLYRIRFFFFFCCGWVAVVGGVRGFWRLLVVVFWCFHWFCIVVVVVVWCLFVGGVCVVVVGVGVVVGGVVVGGVTVVAMLVVFVLVVFVVVFFGDEVGHVHRFTCL